MFYFKNELDFANTNGIEILELKRQNPTPILNKEDKQWDFVIETDKGLISFKSTGFEQVVREEPILSETYNIKRQSSLLLGL